MQIDTKFEFNQRVYTACRDRVVSGCVRTVKCQVDRLGVNVEYDVWIDIDDKLTYDYWMTLAEKYWFATKEEAQKALADTKALQAGNSQTDKSKIVKTQDGRGKN